jgi:hypothetical protein
MLEDDYKLLLNIKTGEVFPADPDALKDRGMLTGFRLVQDMTDVDWILLVQNLIMLHEE